jgi:hypothetical protein
MMASRNLIGLASDCENENKLNAVTYLSITYKIFIGGLYLQ